LKESNTKLLNYGDIIISARGTVGALAQIGIPMCFNQSCFGIRGKTDKVDNDFLFYALRNYVQHIKRRSQGSVFDTINLKSFDLMEIEIPTTISTQQKIAKVLSDLDAKIELNNKINTELEAMAKTLYDYWFVKFDFPDVDGKPYKTSGGKMVYNAELKREIPVGWKNGQLGDVGKVSMCKRVMKHETSSNEEIPFFKISTFGGDANTYISRDLFKLYREKYSYPKRGDILISAAGTIGKIVIFDGESSYFQDSNIVWIDNDGSKIPNCFLFYYYQTEPWVATGGSTIKRLYNDNIRSLKTIFPNSEILKQFSNIINPRLEKKQQIESENKKLSSLRDWLLPMLMNGQVRVGDVEVELGLVAEGNVEYKKH
jgi:type I restriction enzyme S subunit